MVSTRAIRHAIGARRARGIVYLILLFAVALLGVGLAAGGEVWQLHARREREAELLFIGDEVRHAIDAYFDATPGAAKEYPQRVEDLLEDRRYQVPRRYLRRLYLDPFSAKPEWGLIMVSGRLVGIYSLAAGKPVKQGGFTGPDTAFAGADNYQDWRFMAQNLATAPPVQPGAAPAPSPNARAAAAIAAIRR
jgi:hypothetical protein